MSKAARKSKWSKKVSFELSAIEIICDLRIVHICLYLNLFFKLKNCSFPPNVILQCELILTVKLPPGHLTSMKTLIFLYSETRLDFFRNIIAF